MRNSSNHSIIIGIMLFGSCLGMTTPSFSALTNDTIVAIVNDETITLKEFHDYMAAIYMQLASEGQSEKEIKEAMAKYQEDGLNRLIDDKLLIDEANKKKLSIRDKAIDDKIANLRKNYPSDEVFRKAVSEDGLTIGDLRSKLADQMKIRYLVEMEIRSKIFVHPNDVTKYYEEHTSDFNKPERADLESIFISSTIENTNPNERSSKPEELLKKVLEALKNGEDFSEVSNTYSQIPSIGIVERGQTIPEVENVIFNLKEGEISQPVKTSTGTFVFKLKKKFPPETASMSEAKEKIYTHLFNQRFQERMKHWLEDLRKKAYIEIKS